MVLLETLSNHGRYVDSGELEWSPNHDWKSLPVRWNYVPDGGFSYIVKARSDYAAAHLAELSCSVEAIYADGRTQEISRDFVRNGNKVSCAF